MTEDGKCIKSEILSKAKDYRFERKKKCIRMWMVQRKTSPFSPGRPRFEPDSWTGQKRTQTYSCKRSSVRPKSNNQGTAAKRIIIDRNIAIRNED